MPSERHGAANVVILAVAQTVAMSGVTTIVLLGGIIGAELAPTRALATLSVSMLPVGVAAFTIPAAFIMQRFGRRLGFAAAAMGGALAMLLAAFAVSQRSFLAFCAATALVGFQGAFAQQYRFAAAESVAPSAAGRAVSSVLIGGILAGYAGPALARWSTDWLAVPFAGAFALQAALYALTAGLLLGFRGAAPPARDEGEAGRPLAVIVRQPVFMVAVLAGATAYAVMSFIMTATPLELHQLRGFGLGDTAWVIQSHVMAMFAPSLFTGALIDRLGVRPVLLTGTACLTACALGGLVSHHLVHYWGALVLLGLGWNFQFVASTVLLSRASRPPERFRTQAANDFTVFGVQALASLSAGGVLFAVGWSALNLATLPLLALTVAATLRLRPTPAVA